MAMFDNRGKVELERNFGDRGWKRAKFFNSGELLRDAIRYYDMVRINKKHLVIKQIKSPLGKICVIPSDDKRDFILIWDKTYWQFFTVFANVYENIYLAIKGNTKDKAAYIYMTCEYLHMYILLFASKYIKNSWPEMSIKIQKEACKIRKNIHSYRCNKPDLTKQTLRIAKTFALFHEYEHILYTWHHDIFSNDMIGFEKIVEEYRDSWLPEFLKINPDKTMEIIVDTICQKENTNEKIELFNDYHAFFEMLNYYGMRCGLPDKGYYPLFKKVENFYMPIKTLKLFDSYLKLLRNGIDILDSTQHLPSGEASFLCGCRHLEFNTQEYMDFLSCDFIRCRIYLQSQMMLSAEQSMELVNRLSVNGYLDVYSLYINSCLMDSFNHVILLMQGVENVDRKMLNVAYIDNLPD